LGFGLTTFSKNKGTHAHFVKCKLNRLGKHVSIIVQISITRWSILTVMKPVLPVLGAHS